MPVVPRSIVRRSGIASLLLAGSVVATWAQQEPRAAGEPSRSALVRLAGELVTATPERRESLLAADAASLSPALVTTLIDLGVQSYNRQQYREAGEIFRLARDVAITLHDERGLGRALSNIGRAEMELGRLESARDFLKQGLDLLRTLGDLAGEASANGNLAVSYLRENRLAEAQEYFEKALETHSRLDDPATRARILHSLALVSFNQGLQTQALPLYQESLQLRTALGDRAGMGATLNNLGTVYRDQGDYVRALEHYEKSLAIKESLGNDSDIAYTLNNIGIFYKEQGNYRLSLDVYARALAKFEKVHNRDGIGRVLINVGVAYQAQGDYDRALSYYERALAIKQALGDKEGIAIALGNIGEVHHQRASYEKAADYYRRSVTLFEEYGDRSAVAIAYLNLAALCERQQRYSLGLEYLERASALASEVGRDEILWQTRSVAAALYRSTNQPAKARAALEEAIAIIESLRGRVAGAEEAQQLYFESRLAPYQALVGLLVDEGRPAEALLAAERAKGRVLLDVVRSGRLDVTTAMTDAEKKQEAELIGRLNSLNARRLQERTRPTPDTARVTTIEEGLEQARLALEAFHTRLYSSHPELRLRRGEAPTMAIADARDLLPDAKTVLLEFGSNDESTYLFVVRLRRPQEAMVDAGAPVHVSAYRLPVGQKQLTQRILNFRQMLATADNRYARAARELYDLLLAPAAADLQGATHLVVVPDGALWELPFQVLRTARAEDLIDRYAVSLAPSLSVLRETLRRRAQQGGRVAAGAPTALVMGNPRLGGEAVGRVQALMDERLESLPEAERQVRAVQRLYGRARSKMYLGDQALEEEFKRTAASFRVVHVATHGILNDRSPMYSHLVLAHSPDSLEDGLLEAREIMQLDMAAEVAVLSACETARGRIGRGEGIIGLTWALLVAGVPTTVVSQWKVRSDSTADLMIGFHRRLRARLAQPAGRSNVATALRAAALEIKRDPRYRHPFHWAPFVVIGNGY